MLKMFRNLTILFNVDLYITFREVDVGKLVGRPVLTGEVLQQTLDRGVRGSDQIDRFHGGHRFASLLNCFANYNIEIIRLLLIMMM